MNQRYRSYMWGLVLLALAAPGFSQQAAAETISGKAQVIDARTMVVAGRTVRLWSIWAPALDYVCDADGRTIACGRVARTGLMDLTAGATVRCALMQEVAPGINQARCSADGYDLGANMVHTGWGRPDRSVSDSYTGIEVKSMKAHHGLWRWRAQRERMLRDAAVPAANKENAPR